MPRGSRRRNRARYGTRARAGEPPARPGGQASSSPAAPVGVFFQWLPDAPLDRWERGGAGCNLEPLRGGARDPLSGGALGTRCPASGTSPPKGTGATDRPVRRPVCSGPLAPWERCSHSGQALWPARPPEDPPRASPAHFVSSTSLFFFSPSHTLRHWFTPRRAGAASGALLRFPKNSFLVRVSKNRLTTTKLTSEPARAAHRGRHGPEAEAALLSGPG